MKRLLILALALWMAAPVLAQDTGPSPRIPTCTIATLAGCAGDAPGSMAIVNDALRAGDCDTGGGTAYSLCIRKDATTFYGVPIFLLENAIQGTVVGDFIFHNATAGSVDLQGQTAGSAGAMSLGLNQTTITIDTDGEGTGELVVPNMGVGATEIYQGLREMRFCGQGANGTTENYMGVLLEDGTDYTFGSAGCDANDNTTIATADEPYCRGGCYVHYMNCYMAGTATSQTVTFQLYDDTAAVSGASCQIATGDSSFKRCNTSSTDEDGWSIVDNSALAVGVVGSGAGDLSAVDAECWVHFRSN